MITTRYIAVVQALVIAVVAMCAGGCDVAYPEVVVINRLTETIQIRDISFNGCHWDELLVYDQASTIRRCPPGDDHLHFQKFDGQTYRELLDEYDAWEICCGENADGDVDVGDFDCASLCEEDIPVSKVPLWFNYQTVSVEKVDCGGFYTFIITSDNIEQDFSVTGPYGH